jgi:hypothetical protein
VVSTTPWPLYPRERPGTHWASGPTWTCAKNLAPTGIRSPDRPARSHSLYRLSYPAQKETLDVVKIFVSAVVRDSVGIEYVLPCWEVERQTPGWVASFMHLHAGPE